MTYIRLSACRATSLPGQPLFTCLLPPFLLLFFLFPSCLTFPASCCARRCFLLPFCLFVSISDFYLPWNICSLGLLSSFLPSLSLFACPFVAFYLGKDMPSAGTHTRHTHTHTQVSSLFLSLSLCVRVSCGQFSLLSSGGKARCTGTEIGKYDGKLFLPAHST